MGLLIYMLEHRSYPFRICTKVKRYKDIFIISLHRFINDRGSSKNIVSDCRTKFKGTAKELNISTINVKEFEDKRGMQC